MESVWHPPRWSDSLIRAFRGAGRPGDAKREAEPKRGVMEGRAMHRRNSSVSIVLEEGISALSALSKAEFLTRWREKLKQPAPLHLNKPILVPLLAYKLEEQAFGGLKPAYNRRLRELAESFERNPNQLPKTVSSAARIKLGTRLIRHVDISALVGKESSPSLTGAAH